MLNPATIETIGELIAGLSGIVIEAFTTKDPAKLQKVTDVLAPDHPARIRAMLRMQEEIARQQFDARKP